jgi:hypothetical protein
MSTAIGSGHLVLGGKISTSIFWIKGKKLLLIRLCAKVPKKERVCNAYKNVNIRILSAVFFTRPIYRTPPVFITLVLGLSAKVFIGLLFDSNHVSKPGPPLLRAVLIW